MVSGVGVHTVERCVSFVQTESQVKLVSPVSPYERSERRASGTLTANG